MKRPKPLKLLAAEPADLQILSAALQDAAGLIGDFVYEPKARRFTVALNRYRWEAKANGRGERVRAALQFGGVLSAKSQRLRQGAKDAVVALLALEFEPDADPESPGGVLTLTFAGGGALALEVECIDAALADVSQPWRAAARPDHERGDRGEP